MTDADRPGNILASPLPDLDLRRPPALAALPKPVQSVPAARNDIEPYIVAASEGTRRYGPLPGAVQLESENLGARWGRGPEFVRLGGWGRA